MVIDDISFRWSAEPFPTNGRGFGSSPFRDMYFREYAGYANSVCYRIHLHGSSTAQGNSIASLENVLATLKIFPRIPDHETPPGTPELPFAVPGEIVEILRLASWKLSYPRGGSRGILPVPSFTVKPVADINTLSLTYLSSSQNIDAIMADIRQTEQRVGQLLKEHGWSEDHSVHSSLPTYSKNGCQVEFAEGTDRCTMNSPCTEFDILTVSVRIPVEVK